MARFHAYIDGIGLIGPGFHDWAGARAILTGGQDFQSQPTVIPAPAALPAAERRRCGAIVKISLAAGYQAAAHAGADVATLPTVFTASGGDGANCHEICQMLASDDRQISPTRFHNSVHNAASGYWSIASGAMAPSSVLCAYDGSFGAGLLETLAQVRCEDRPVLLIAADTPYPEPLRSTRPIPHECAVALVISPSQGARSLARIEAELCDAPAARMADLRLEALRMAIPAARALPMLGQLAAGTPGSVVLDYLDGCAIAVAMTPCS
ncbi:beta-ketoacyl synthase chain length factor [Noviherbaspirillum aridicola]|uniref:Beta-ketoacyl synthase-like N-terminal domain-containing protein n=1 Tax=Noviherbaspirillum aridicola TaxID=2849687 RepID=A0ABQ4Q698_9BURK|nr:beta-ketoacyl synthase chain length factor [Noviherbaspirillum aridicola]GIZ52556.1 hypothetical protein NCCP691_25700 [Noviherbaspirillum aridicola]